MKRNRRHRPKSQGATVTVAVSDFSDIHPSEVLPAIAELEALGFIEVVGLDGAGAPNRFRMSDGWRAIKTMEQALAAKRRARPQWWRA
jgi:hypothetical protein